MIKLYKKGDLFHLFVDKIVVFEYFFVTSHRMKQITMINPEILNFIWWA